MFIWARAISYILFTVNLLNITTKFYTTATFVIFHWEKVFHAECVCVCVCVCVNAYGLN